MKAHIKFQGREGSFLKLSFEKERIRINWRFQRGLGCLKQKTPGGQSMELVTETTRKYQHRFLL